MRIKKIKLTNFKLFENQEIPLKKITLLTGTNSSGKSTILNAVTAILQSRSPHIYPLDFVANGKNCMLGSYKDIVHGNNTRKSFGVGIDVDFNRKKVSISAHYRYSSSGNQTLPQKLSVEDDGNKLDLIWGGVNAGYRLKVSSVRYFEPPEDEELTSLYRAVALLRASQNPEEAFDESRFKAVLEEQRSKVDKWFRLKSRSPIEITEEIRAQPIGEFILDDIFGIQRQMANNITYVGPMRAHPSRHYESRDMAEDMDPTGANSIERLLEWKKYNPARFREVLKLAKTLELATEISVNSTGDQLFKLEVKPKKNSHLSNFADVGFGISQILPILIADVGLPTDGTLLINQPEVHLHPSSQAALGNLFASRIKKRNYLIETHSEYLINRLRLLVAQGKLKSSEVSVIFLDCSKNDSCSPAISFIDLCEDGSLKGAPQSFFDTYYSDSFKLATAGME